MRGAPFFFIMKVPLPPREYSSSTLLIISDLIKDSSYLSLSLILPLQKLMSCSLCCFPFVGHRCPVGTVLPIISVSILLLTSITLGHSFYASVHYSCKAISLRYFQLTGFNYFVFGPFAEFFV